MEKKINQLLPQQLTPNQNSCEASGEIKLSETAPDKEILAALNSKKIIDSSSFELDKIVTTSVAQIFAYVGKKNDPGVSDLLNVIYNILPGELRREVPALRLNEIPISFKKGALKEFGEYFGLNVAELVRFCKAHYDSENRTNTVKSILKPVEKPSAAPSLESQFYTSKNNTITAYTKNQVGGNFEAMGPACYDFINKLGLIIFSTKEKYDLMKEAAGKIISETNLKLSVIPEDYHRRPLKAFIHEIENWLNEDINPTNLTYAKIIAKSKFLTLKAFFHEIQESELSLNDLIDNKKYFFVNE